MKRFSLFAPVAIGMLNSCTSLPPEQVAPFETTALLEARARAEPCATPAQANFSDGKNFRYGCFCGKNYPQLVPETSEQLAVTPSSQLDSLVARYYAIKPYDDLDAACQAHDVCYVLSHGPRRACDERFSSRTQQLWHDFNQEVLQRLRNPSSEPYVNPMARRCNNLAMHLTLATYFFEGKSDDSAYELQAKSIKLLFGTTAVGIAATLLPINTYPDVMLREHCNAEDNRAIKLPGAWVY